MGSSWPRHSSRGAGRQGLRLLVLRARRRCGENLPTPEVAQGGRSPAVVSGTGGRGLETKLLLLCPIALVPVGLVESRSFACSPTRPSLWPTAVSWPPGSVEGRGVASSGMGSGGRTMGSGIQVRRAPAAGDRARHPVGLPERVARSSPLFRRSGGAVASLVSCPGRD